MTTQIICHNYTDPIVGDLCYALWDLFLNTGPMFDLFFMENPLKLADEIQASMQTKIDDQESDLSKDLKELFYFSENLLLNFYELVTPRKTDDQTNPKVRQKVKECLQEKTAFIKSYIASNADCG